MQKCDDIIPMVVKYVSIGDIFMFACMYNNIKIIKMAIELGYNDFNKGLYYALKFNNPDIADMMIEYCSNIVDTCMVIKTRDRANNYIKKI